MYDADKIYGTVGDKIKTIAPKIIEKTYKLYKKDKKSQINLSKGDKSSKQKSKKMGLIIPVPFFIFVFMRFYLIYYTYIIS